MHLIDTHTHIYLPAFDQDRQQCINRAKEKGIEAFYLPAIDTSTHQMMLETEQNHEGCKAMMGLHPCSVKENVEAELVAVAAYLQQRSFIAVGEIGLDFYWDKTFVAQQYDAFHRQIHMALQYSLPISIHSRAATNEAIEVVAQYPKLRGVFHCFSGDGAQAEKIISLGFMLGIGGVVSFKNAGLDAVLAATGLSHVVLETDAPYLAPVPFRGKRNEPAYTALVAEKLAQVCGLSVEAVAETTTKNAKKLFGT